MERRSKQVWLFGGGDWRHQVRSIVPHVADSVVHRPDFYCLIGAGPQEIKKYSYATEQT